MANINIQLKENKQILETYTFSEYKSLYSKKKSRDLSLFEFLEKCINKGESSLLIESIRKTKNKVEKDELKKKLECVALSGTFENEHTDKALINHSGLIQLDFDNIQNIDETIDKLKHDKYVFSLFLSPSGTGIKGIVKIDGNNHKENFFGLEKYFFEKYQLKLDEKCKNISRLFFYSYDPNLFLNPTSKVFEQIQPNTISRTGLREKKAKISIHHPKTPSECWKFTEQKEDYIEGNRNNFCFMYANRCNEAGLSQNEALEYAIIHCVDISENEVRKSIESAYLNISEHGKHRYKEIVESIESPKKSNSPKDYSNNSIKAKDHVSNQSERERIITGLFKKINDSEGKIKDVSIQYNGMVELMCFLGYRRFDIENDHIVVKIENNVLSQETPTFVQQNVFKFIDSFPEILPNDVPKSILVEKLRKSRDKLFNKGFLTMLTPEKDYIFNVDTRNEVFIYYQNGFVKVTPNGIEFLEYNKLNKYIWKNQILDRNFKQLDVNYTGDFIFSKFILNVCNNDKVRFLSLNTLIGYLLHNFFETKLKAVVFTDSSITEEPNGRTGKTLLGKALEKIKPTTIINGKTFIPDDRFRYQEVSYETQIIFLNDLKPHFHVETLFNDITEKVKIERKNQPPVSQYAKFLIATNRTLKIVNASAKDRFIEFEFSEHYSDKFSPIDEFKKVFFGHDFTENDWYEFDNFICSCIQEYLKAGIIEAPVINLHRRKAIEETNLDFVNWFESLLEMGFLLDKQEYNKAELHNKFLNDYPDWRTHKYVSQQKTFSKFVSTYCRYHDSVKFTERKSNDKRFYTFSISPPSING